VTASVVTENPEYVVKAAEAFGRAIAGLALEGINVGLNIGTVEDEDDGTN
jgi:hypothetical protein